jgi:chemotaxis protein CheD
VSAHSVAERRTVGISELLIGRQPDVLVTYALGSCLGIALFDPVSRVGGLLHVMLPESQIDPAKARSIPAMFVDTGVPLLFRTCYAAGAVKERILVKVAGGANTHDAGDFFQVGKRNFLKLRQLLWKNGVLLNASDVGGTQSRTMSIDLSTGEVLVKVNGGTARAL